MRTGTDGRRTRLTADTRCTVFLGNTEAFIYIVFQTVITFFRSLSSIKHSDVTKLLHINLKIIQLFVYFQVTD